VTLLGRRLTDHSGATYLLATTDVVAVEQDFVGKVAAAFAVDADSDRADNSFGPGIVRTFRFADAPSDTVTLLVSPLLEGRTATGTLVSLAVDRSREEGNDVWITYPAFGWTNEVPNADGLRLVSVGFAYDLSGEGPGMTSDAVFNHADGAAGAMAGQWAAADQWRGAMRPSSGVRSTGGASVLVRRSAPGGASLNGTALFGGAGTDNEPGSISIVLQDFGPVAAG
jgi:hypothetical protein